MKTALQASATPGVLVVCTRSRKLMSLTAVGCFHCGGHTLAQEPGQSQVSQSNFGGLIWCGCALLSLVADSLLTCVVVLMTLQWDHRQPQGGALHTQEQLPARPHRVTAGEHPLRDSCSLDSSNHKQTFVQMPER
jgi:hypothetical protein